MSTSYEGFFGDRVRTFHLTPKLIDELERITGVGLGALFTRLINRDWRYSDITETIRLGLIGGGAAPEEAASLVRVYAGDDVPIVQILPVAVEIVTARWFGTSAKDQLAEGAAQ